ncbi:MAG TPA: HAD family hydrolase [Actinopolymorphaceae bacterium]|nr:HAD family hydrolase [Actinopolymorphaceae bacterium]
MRSRAVVFDLYETLVTEFESGWQPQPAPAERLGIQPEIFDRVWRARKADRMTRTVDYRDVLREACEAAGAVPPASVEPIIATLYAERLDTKAGPLLDVERPVLDALRVLRDMGYKLALVSNCSVEEVAAWERSPLAPMFDDVLFSYRVGIAKPAGAIYVEACARLQVLPEHCAYVGDGGSDELAGAALAGMTAYCARWFLDRWPAWRRSRTDAANAAFPQLSSPAELLSVIGVDQQPTAGEAT